jgi:hypothetical protein
MPAFQICGELVVVAYARQIGVALEGRFPSGSFRLPGLRASVAILGHNHLARKPAGPLHDVLHKGFEHQEIGSLLVPPLDVGFDDYDAVGPDDLVYASHQTEYFKSLSTTIAHAPYFLGAVSLRLIFQRRLELSGS